MDELKKLLAEAQTDEPWSVVWYGDEHLPAIAIHRTAEDRICFMPTIQHPADGVQFEANAALICAAVNALPELLAENEKLREALRLFMGAATPVSTEIDPRGYVWSLGYLDQARTALKETGQ